MSDVDERAPANLYYLTPQGAAPDAPRLARHVAEGPLLVIARAVLAVPAAWREALWIECDGRHVTLDEVVDLVRDADARFEA